MDRTEIRILTRLRLGMAVLLICCDCDWRLPRRRARLRRQGRVALCRLFAVCDVLRHVAHGSVWAGEGSVDVFYSHTLRRLSLAKAIESCRDVGYTRL